MRQLIELLFLSKTIPLLSFMAGAFLVCFSTCMIGFLIFLVKRKHGILDFFWGISISSSIILLTLPRKAPYISAAINLQEIGSSVLIYTIAPLFLFLIFILLWGGRLTVFFLTRLTESGDDRRYVKLIQSSPKKMVTQCVIQATLQTLMACTAYPLVSAMPTFSLVWVIIGTIIFLVGFFGEWVADRQASFFKATNTGICQTGLWARSRHPNYFFECLLWLGLSLFLINTTSGGISFLGPLTIFIVTYFITGPISERTSIDRHGDAYRHYQSTTPYFFPRV
jgi:steroid 5-alpha reductase family enzyme